MRAVFGDEVQAIGIMAGGFGGGQCKTVVEAAEAVPGGECNIVAVVKAGNDISKAKFVEIAQVWPDKEEIVEPGRRIRRQAPGAAERGKLVEVVAD